MSLNLIPFLYKLHKLRKNQWRSPAELQRLQGKKLKAILHHAYYKVDYYRRLFNQAAIKPEDIKTTQDLFKIPITTRKELQVLPKKEIIAKRIDLSRCINLRTSGSTGMPLDIFLSDREIMTRWAFYRRLYFENGGKLCDRILRITTPQNFRNTQWFQYLGILQEKNISIFEETENQLKAILEFRPDIIVSFASNLKNLVIEIKKIKIEGINLRIIFCTAELLTGQDRKFISSVLQAELFDYYSCNECGIIAWECRERSGYHINSDNVIVEFTKEDGTYAKAGEQGEIVITSLNSYTMPFIRYRLGDIGIPSDEKCPCGRGLPLMKIITGRINDYIILPNGKKISYYMLRTLIEEIPEVKKYKIIQEKKDKIRIDILYDKTISLDVINKIKSRYKDNLGEDIDIEIRVVEEITNNKTGKFQFVSLKKS